MTTTATALATEAVVREFGNGESAVRAVDGVTVNIAPGEFVALVGRSGSGKTTLLNLLAGLDRPSDGRVWFEGRELSDLSEKELVGLRRERIGFVFQSFGLIPLLSAFENVELPLHIGGVSWRERRRLANDALELVGLLGRSGHRPYELSGGEQQRVAIATGPGGRPVRGVRRRAHRRTRQRNRREHRRHPAGNRRQPRRNGGHRHPRPDAGRHGRPPPPDGRRQDYLHRRLMLTD